MSSLGSRLSSLNPNAAAFVPASKREASGESSVSFNHDMSHGIPQKTTQNLSTSQACNVKSQSEASSSGATVQGESQMLDDESEMDLDFLRMQFSNVSDQSLIDAYMFHGRDVDATMDMLNYLEFDGAPSAEDQGLPDTLDIGDTSESRVVDSASLKLKKSADEAGASGPSAPSNIS